MQTPFFHKDDLSRDDCAIHCLRMALAAFGFPTTSDQLYKDASSFGPTGYTVPWGICIAAARRRLHVTFISKGPVTLLSDSIDDIERKSRIPSVTIKRKVKSMIQKCRHSQFVHLVDWREGFEKLPEKLVEKHVVIPTIWGGKMPHNVVLMGVLECQVQYHDPEYIDGKDRRMAVDAFQKLWLHPRTDHDLLIISKSKLDVV